MPLPTTYRLRGCEVAALTLDDIDWGNDRLRIRERKAGNSTTYPLSTVVCTAIVDYLKNGYPISNDRAVFLRAMAPLVPISSAGVATRVGYYIRQARITVSLQRLLWCHVATPSRHQGMQPDVVLKRQIDGPFATILRLHWTAAQKLGKIELHTVEDVPHSETL